MNSGRNADVTHAVNLADMFKKRVVSVVRLEKLASAATHPCEPFLGDFRVQVGVAILLAESLLDNGRLPEVLHGEDSLRETEKEPMRQRHEHEDRLDTWQKGERTPSAPCFKSTAPGSASTSLPLCASDS